jgi:glutathione S-transferase
MVRKQVKRTLYGQGLGRHSKEDLEYFAEKDFAALDGLLGDKPYMMGDRLCSVDATVYGGLSSIYYPDFDTRLKAIALGHPHLAAYCDRITERFFPEYARKSGTRAAQG